MAGLVLRRGLDLAAMSTWRNTSTYPDDVAAVSADADEWVAAYVRVPLVLCEHTFDAIRRAAGDSPEGDTAARAWQRHSSAITARDPRTGEPGIVCA